MILPHSLIRWICSPAMGNKLADGTYMDREERRFTYNGTDTWTDENGTEWNEVAKD